MNEELKKEKLGRFLTDTIMVKCVYDVLIASFLKPHPLCDVNLLAASRLAIDLLQEGWEDLEKFTLKAPEQMDTQRNVGM